MLGFCQNVGWQPFLCLNVNNNNAGDWKMCLVFVEIRKKRIFNVKWLEKDRVSVESAVR